MASQSIPDGDPTPDGIDALINAEMCRLSIGEREKVIEDVHGVADEFHETSEFVEEMQSLLTQELEDLPSKDAYDKAITIDRGYVENPDFRLKFLRTEEFDAKKAAFRLARHFEYKLNLFGEEYLAKDIVQDDLTEEDLDCLYCGFMQPLPTKDRAGRTINMWIPALKPNQKLTSKMRRLFYSIMVQSEDTSTQKKGMVAIVCLTGITFRAVDRVTSWNLASFTQAFPIKFVGIHICYDNPLVLPLVALGQLAAGTFTRLRFRSHYGSQEDFIYALQSFGVPKHALPFDSDGKINIEQNRTIWEKRRKHERMVKKVSRVMVPGPRDVLFGRGRLCQEHIGNVSYRFLIEQEKVKYDLASKSEKTKIAREIMKKIEDAGGHFLKDDDSAGWVSVGDDIARAKVAHCFRSFRASKTGSKSKTGSVRSAPFSESDDSSLGSSSDYLVTVTTSTKRPRNS